MNNKIGYSAEQPNQTLARGLLILESFTEEHPEWGVRELGRALRVNVTTIHRLVSTLANIGYLERNPENQRYRLGPKIMKLAAVYSAQNPLANIAQQVFERHAHRFEHSFYLGVLRGFEVTYVTVSDGRGPIKLSVEPGGSAALYATAMGKVLLASQSDEFIRLFLAATPLLPLTPRTVTDEKELWKQVATIRAQGYATNFGESYEDIGSVAVPIHGQGGRVVAGMSLSFPQHYLDTGKLQIDDLLQIAQEVGNEISLRSAGTAPA